MDIVQCFLLFRILYSYYVYCGFCTIFPPIEDIVDVVQCKCRVAQFFRSWEPRAEEGKAERGDGGEKERVRHFDPQKISYTRAKKGAFCVK